MISAKKAKKDIERIKGLHSNILDGMAQHQLKVQQYNDQQGMLKREQDAIQGERQMKDKEMEFNGRQQNADREFNSQKESMNYNLKTKELEVKRMALTQPE